VEGVSVNILLTGHYKHIFQDGNCFKEKKGTFLDNNFFKFTKLKDAFAIKGANLIASHDIISYENIDAIIVNDQPKDKELLMKIKAYSGPKFLIAEEAPFIYPENYDLKRTSEYNLIFTYLHGNILNEKYVYAFPFFLDRNEALKVRQKDIDPGLKIKKVFVGTQKKPQEKSINNSNYSIRDSLIRWYMNHDPSDFDLYGRKWDRRYFDGDGLIQKVFNYHKLDNFSVMKSNQYASVYRGQLRSKYEELSKYKYQFCFENSIGYEGFITEKIIDSLICRNVPVYYPSTKTSLLNIIPDDIYINIYNFKSFEVLNSYLNGMGENEYQTFISKIDDFIDNLPKILHEQYWATLVVNSVLSKIDKKVYE
jgi:hypothetical protein